MAEAQENENLMAAASYLGFIPLGWLTGFIFLFIEKQSKFVRFHAIQSIMFSGGTLIAVYIFLLIPILGWLVNTALFAGGFILWLVLMWKAFQGEKYKVPYIGDLAEKQLAKMSGK